MGRIWDWLRRKKPKETPESAFRVTADDQEISVAHAGALAQTVRISELQGVLIETNESGPLGIDCWWLLFGRDDRLVAAFPQGAEGGDSAIERLMKLPGFDFEEMTAAMGTVEDDVFPVWRLGRPARTQTRH